MNTVDYTHFMSIIIPDIPSILATAQAVSASLDPGDGFPAFGMQLRDIVITPATEETPEVIEAGTESYRYYGCPMTEVTFTALPYMKANPAALKAVVDTAFAERWPEGVPPTLTELEAFCTAVELFPDAPLSIVLINRQLLIYNTEEV